MNLGQSRSQALLGNELGNEVWSGTKVLSFLDMYRETSDRETN